jgi:hypothetical protein
VIDLVLNLEALILNNELNYSNQDLVNVEIADFNEAFTISYNAILFKILSDPAIFTDALLIYWKSLCWKSEKVISKRESYK